MQKLIKELIKPGFVPGSYSEPLFQKVGSTMNPRLIYGGVGASLAAVLLIAIVAQPFIDWTTSSAQLLASTF